MAREKNERKDVTSNKNKKTVLKCNKNMKKYLPARRRWEVSSWNWDSSHAYSRVRVIAPKEQKRWKSIFSWFHVCLWNLWLEDPYSRLKITLYINENNLTNEEFEMCSNGSTYAKEQYVTTLKSNFKIIYYSDPQTKQLFLGIKIL